MPPPFPKPAPLDAHELAQLEHLAAAPELKGRALGPSGVEGLAAALALTPTMLTPSRWMPRVWDPDEGRRQPVFDGMEQVNHAWALLMRLYNGAVLALGPARDGQWQPLYRGGDAAQAAEFCRGFAAGMALDRAGWKRLRDAEPGWVRDFAEGRADAAALDERLPRIRLVMGLAPFFTADAADAADPWRVVERHFRVFERPFPRAAVEWALGHREVLAPRFAAALAALAEDPAPALADDGPDMLHHFAIAFLGHWRDERGWAPMLAVLRLPYETLDLLFGDGLFETYSRALASVCPGDTAPLAALAADDSLSYRVRTVAIDAWLLRVVLCGADAADFGAAMQSIGERSAQALRRARPGLRDDPPIIDHVARVADDVDVPTLHAAVRGWLDEGLIDRQVIGRDEFDRALAKPLAERRLSFESRRRGLIEDPTTEIAWWAQYTEDDEPPPQTVVRSGPKIGRNDPCPCGSGRKYKKCHGAH